MDQTFLDFIRVFSSENDVPSQPNPQAPVIHTHLNVTVGFVCLFLYWSEMDFYSPVVLFTRNVKKIKSATDIDGDFDGKASFTHTVKYSPIELLTSNV